MNQNALMMRLREAGIDLRAARNSAMRALVLEIPAENRRGLARIQLPD
ncbi:hypothetical protein P4U43_06420 [Arthrobacter sp. EH-1B-1]|uniref:Uncharacterized protein n=1 Tax=Arthrobacter vasquezii TaxID=2977629 RepID=A0ABT6CUI0_9MICC|nr:hypothetical protein [Arthrobacter vasquezii]MDF9277426.1 hypothetical protein [Arthrobacter vasquezii]